MESSAVLMSDASPQEHTSNSRKLAHMKTWTHMSLLILGVHVIINIAQPLLVQTLYRKPFGGFGSLLAAEAPLLKLLDARLVTDWTVPLALVFWESLVSLLISVIVIVSSHGMIKWTSVNLNVTKLHLRSFLPQLALAAALEWWHRLLYYDVLRNVSSGVLSLWLHFQLPLITLMQCSMAKSFSSQREAWKNLFVLSSGIAITLVGVAAGGHILSIFLMCLQSASLYLLNEKILQSSSLDVKNLCFFKSIIALFLSWTTCFSSNVLSKVLNFDSSLPDFYRVFWSLVILGAFVSLSKMWMQANLFEKRDIQVSDLVITLGLIFLDCFLFSTFPFILLFFIPGMIIFTIGYLAYANLFQNFSLSAKHLSWRQQRRAFSQVLKEYNTRKLSKISLTIVGLVLLLEIFVSLKKWTVSSPSFFEEILIENTSKSLHEEKLLSLFNQSPVTLIMYASRTHHGVCRTLRSVQLHNATLIIMGYGRSNGKEEKPVQYVKISEWAARQVQRGRLSENHILAFMDSFDVIVQRDADYVREAFDTFGADFVNSAEKGCWPFNKDKEAESVMCPQFDEFPGVDKLKEIYKSSGDGKAPLYLNSGFMACKAKACSQWFKDSLSLKPKYFTTDDQAIAATACLKYGKEKCLMDGYSKLAQSMHWSVQDIEWVPYENGWRNNRTLSMPAFIHFNGDKSLLIPMAEQHFHSRVLSYLSESMGSLQEKLLPLLPWEQKPVNLILEDRIQLLDYHDLCSPSRFGLMHLSMTWPIFRIVLISLLLLFVFIINVL